MLARIPVDLEDRLHYEVLRISVKNGFSECVFIFDLEEEAA